MREEGSPQNPISDKVIFARGLLNNRTQMSPDKVKFSQNSFVLRLNFLAVPPKRRAAKHALPQGVSLQATVTGGHSS